MRIGLVLIAAAALAFAFTVMGCGETEEAPKSVCDDGADNDGDDHNEKALAQRKVEETRDHQACFFRSSDFKTKAP